MACCTLRLHTQRAVGITLIRGLNEPVDRYLRPHREPGLLRRNPQDVTPELGATRTTRH